MNGYRPIKVLFLCYGNSCRSILAEALARYYWGAGAEVASAGLFPLGHITPHTLAALREEGVPTDGLYSKGLADVGLEDFDFLVNLTELKLDDLIYLSFRGKTLSCAVRDPFGEDLDSFRSTRNTLKKLIMEKLPGMIGKAIASKK
jgi:protein-tyrosine-phosphatase